MASLKKHGYDVDLVSGLVADNLKCSSCAYVLRDTVQSSCGHRFCAECLEEIYRRSTTPTCQVDQKLLIKEKGFRDAFAEREVQSLVILCPSRKVLKGCNWTGELRKLKDHEDVCDFIPRPCPNGCDQLVSECHHAVHTLNECLARLVRCEFCQREMKLNQMARHKESCAEAPTSCPNACSSQMYPLSQMPEHLAVCPKQKVKCFYAAMGCKFEGHRCELPAHHEANLAYHLQVCSKQAQGNQETIEFLVKQNSLLAEKCASLEDGLVCLQARVERSTTASTGMRTSCSSDDRSAESHESRHEVAGLNEVASAHAERIALVERSVAFHDVRLSELDIRQSVQEIKMCNGVLVWKISNFCQRRQDAISGKTPSLYSPPFYTSPAGYKVCGRIYPNGDGVGRGTHLSFFVVIMRGEFDAILSWPFSQKVSLVLLDQHRVNPRDIVETFRPDASSSSYQRPAKEMNVASGCPLFVHLSALSDSSYIREDTVYLKVIIHSQGLKSPDEV